jgi:hypothetical protein
MRMEDGKFKWPTGEIRSLSGSIPTHPFVVVRYPVGDPSQAKVVSPVVFPQSLQRDFFHYVAGHPKSTAKCRGCGRVLDKEDLCLQTQLICILTHCRICTYKAEIVLQYNLQYNLIHLAYFDSQFCTRNDIFLCE